MAIRHFLDIDNFDQATLRRILDNAHEMKSCGRALPDGYDTDQFQGDVLLMIFEKPSTRTRVSFDVGMRQLGGESVVLNREDLQLGRGECIEDTARVLSRYGDVVMLRVLSHETLLEFARHSSVPVINGLSDRTHPCQIMADIMTFEERKGAIEGQTLAWVGDGNNVAVSFIHAAVILGFNLRLGLPRELSPDGAVFDWAKARGGQVEVFTDPAEAVEGAECVITDTWVSMGDGDKERRTKLLEPYAVTESLMEKAAPDAIFMHCLPAYRGSEVSAEVIDGPRSAVFDEAENRLHAQKAVLAWCLKGDRKTESN